MYFEGFPVLPYPFYVGDKRRYALAKNILRRVAFSDRVNKDAAFLEYSIKDGERPEHIAYRVYGNANHHWIILLANNIIDPYREWCKSEAILQEYIQKNYSGTCVYFTDRSSGFTYNSAFFSGCTLEQSGKYSSITNYRDTFCEFTVDSPAFVTGNAAVQMPSGVTVGVYIHKISPAYIGIHHFTISKPTTGDGSNGAQENPIIDPFTKQSSDYEGTGTVFGNQIPVSLVGGVTGATVDFWDTYIGRWMGVSGDEYTDYGVTNFTYETGENEKKRTIKILSPEYLSLALKELSNALGV